MIAEVAIDAPLTGFATPYPYHLANCGDFDICGFKRPQSVYRDILWGVRTAPSIGVLVQASAEGRVPGEIQLHHRL